LPLTGQSEMQYAWIDATSEPVVITDEKGRFLAANHAFERLFALTGARLASEPVEDLIIASRFRSAYRAARQTALTDERPSEAGHTSEFVAVGADGGDFAVALSFTCTCEVPVQVATWIRDLSEDNTSLTKTLPSAAMNDRTEELAGFGHWEWTPESERLKWSDNLFRIYGMRPGDIIPSAEHVVAHCHADDQQRVQQAVQLGRSGRHPELRYRYLWPDGTVRHLRSTVMTVARSDGRSRTAIGTVQDVTEQHQTEIELAARFAVSDCLSHWEPGLPGSRRLVKDLAEALEFDEGTMWVPRGDALKLWVIWQARGVHAPKLEAALREIRFGRAVGLAGHAWASAEPARVTDLTDDAAEVVRAIDTQTGRHGQLAVPATHGEEVLAVFAFASQHQAVLSDRFRRSLIGIGHEIGNFLAQRRGELRGPALTPRELQVLQLSATGHARRQIAEQMHISEATVKTHFEHIYRKLEVPDRASAVGAALRQGLIH
jgi:PAS domain S-box-containing protein